MVSSKRPGSFRLRRSDRLKNVNVQSNTLDPIMKQYARRRARPRNLIAKDQVSNESHNVVCNSKVIKSNNASSPLNLKKDTPSGCKSGKPRKVLPGCNRTKEADGNPPISSPIWSGGICISGGNFGVVEGLAVHISSKATVKAFEVASAQPILLCAEMLPRLDVWPDEFVTCPPTDDIIDLYILPLQRRTYGAFESLLNEMTEKNLVMKAVIDNVPILVFTSLQLNYKYWRASGGYYLWAVFVGKNALFPLEKHNSLQNFDCNASLNLTNEVHTATGCQRTLSKNGNSEECSRMMDKTETLASNFRNDGSILLAPCALAGKSIGDQPTVRAVNEGLIEEGIRGTIVDSIRHEVDARGRISTDEFTDTSKEVGEKTHMEEMTTAVGIAEVQPNIPVEESLGESIYAPDQLATAGVGASCGPQITGTVEECEFVSVAFSLTQPHPIIPDPPAFHFHIEEQGTFSPERASSESIGTSVLHMASTFDDITSMNEISSTDVHLEQVDSYSVLPRFAPTLCAIINRHGDIAQDFPVTCSKILTFALEKVCETVKDLETVRFINLRKSHLQSLHSAITDAEFAKLDVKWLRNRYEELVEAVDQIKICKNLKDSRKEMDKLAESKKKVISSKKAEVLKLQAEIEILENEVTHAAAESERFSGAITNVTSKCKHFRHNSLVDGLL